jgi:hypothetical protein
VIDNSRRCVGSQKTSEQATQRPSTATEPLFFVLSSCHFQQSSHPPFTLSPIHPRSACRSAVEAIKLVKLRS